MFKKSIALILAIAILLVALPMSLAVSASVPKITETEYTVGNVLWEFDASTISTAPSWAHGKVTGGWGTGTTSLVLADTGAVRLTATAVDGLFYLPEIQGDADNYIYEVSYKTTGAASSAGLAINATESAGATWVAVYAAGGANEGNAYYRRKGTSTLTQTYYAENTFTAPAVNGTTLSTMKIVVLGGNAYTYTDGQLLALANGDEGFTDPNTTTNINLGMFVTNTAIDIYSIKVSSVSVNTSEAGDASAIPDELKNFNLAVGDSVLDVDFTESEVNSGLPEDWYVLLGGSGNNAQVGWGVAGGYNAKVETKNSANMLHFTSWNCDSFLLSPKIEASDYVFEAVIIPNGSNFTGLANNAYGNDNTDIKDIQWFAFDDTDTSYWKAYNSGTQSSGTVTAGSAQDLHYVAGNEYKLRLYSYNGINYYYINDTLIFSVSQTNSNVEKEFDRVGLYAYVGDMYIKSVSVNELKSTVIDLPEGIGMAGDNYYIEGDVIYKPDFSEFTVGSLPEGWSYGHPNGTGETKTAFGWAANTSATASAAVVDHDTLGKVVQFGSKNTDAFMAIPATGTMNYVYEATVVSNTGGGNAIGHANNFYGATNVANGVMYNSIYPAGSEAAKYSYRGSGTGSSWTTSFNHTSGETLKLKIVSLSGNNYIYYNDTLVAIAPWRGGAGTSDNPGFYTYNGNMYVTDVKVTAIATADIDFDAMRVVVNEDETVDLEIEFSFDKTQDVYAKYINGDYSSTANGNFKLGFVGITGNSDVSADLTVDTDGASTVTFPDQYITQDSENVYVKLVGKDMPEDLYHTYVNVRPYVYIDGLYFYGDGAAYSGANLANGAYMTADTEAQKALVEKVLGDCEEFVVGSDAKELTFTLFSDFHYKAGMYSTSMADLRSILKRADDTNSAFILSGGDMCNDLIGSPELTNTYLNYVTEEGELLTAYNIYGNHELESANNTMSFVTPRLTNDANVVWGTADGKIAEDGSIAYYYFEEGGFRIVCVDNNYDYNPNHINGEVVGWEHYLTSSYGGTSAARNATRGFDEGADAKANTNAGSLGDVQMAWLEEVLLDAAAKDIPCIVVGHCGYSGLGFGGGTSEGAAVREIYAKANAANPGTVIMSINGHIHTNNQGWNEGVFYMDTNTTRNNWWQGSGFDHYTNEHTYMYEEYDAQGNLLSVTEKSLNTLSQARNTWFSEDPLSCVITINDAGVVTIDGMESKWAYDVVPAAASTVQGCECRISSGTFWNCDLYGHIEDYVVSGDKHYVECTAYECGYTSAPSAHTFDQQVATDNYKANGATCNDAATYYYSCVCEAKGTATFESGEANGHSPKTEWSKDNTNHWHECNNCDERLDEATHTYDQQVEKAEYKAGNANCNEPATYYYSCVCGAKGTTTFTSGTSNGHDKSDTWTSNDEGHWHACANCTDKLDFDTHTYDQQVVNDTYKAKNADCDDAATYYYSCVCGAKGPDTFENGEANGHTPKAEWDWNSEEHFKMCSVCGIPIDSTVGTHDTQGANCMSLGECTVCGRDGDDYAYDVHDIDEVPAATASHDNDGNIKHYKCNDCGTLFDDANGTNVLSESDVIIDGGDHDYGDDYKSDEDGHWKECACGGKDAQGEHTYGDWKVTKEATASVKGEKVRECTVCGHKDTAEIPVIVSDDDDKDDDNPKTGDTSNVFVWFAILLLSGSVLSFVFALRTSKRRKQH